MLQSVLNKSWKQQPRKYQLYGHLPPIAKTIQVRWTRHAGHYWRSKDKLISDILMWTPSHGQANVGRPTRTYIQQLCADTGPSLEAMDNWEGWQERVRDIRASSTTWGYIYIYIYIYIYTHTHTFSCVGIDACDCNPAKMAPHSYIILLVITNNT